MTLPDRKDPCAPQGCSSQMARGGAALEYLRLGWAPVPLCWPTHDGRCGCGRGHTGKDIGKAPLLGKGYQNLVPSERDVRQWWRMWPRANIGVLLAPSGLLVADADGPAGVTELHLQRPLPLGPISRSGGGGEHRWFRVPAHVSGRTTKRGESHALDILASGYVVAPPSVHRSGQFYTWLISPEDAPPPDAPPWALELLAQSAPHTKPARVSLPSNLPPADLACLPLSSRARGLLVNGVTTAVYSSRSEGLFAAIAALVRAGIDDGTIARAVWNSPAGQKAREQGERWLADEIARVRIKVGLAAQSVQPVAMATLTRPQGVAVPSPVRPQGIPVSAPAVKGDNR